VAAVEQELHAQTDAERGQAVADRIAQFGARSFEAGSRRTERAHTGQHQRVRTRSAARILHERHARPGLFDRLPERMEVACTVIEDRDVHSLITSRCCSIVAIPSIAASTMSQGPTVIRMHSPRPGSAGNGRTATPAARSPTFHSCARAPGGSTARTKFAA